MKSFGISMDGPLVIERVDILPTWTSSLVGRMVYERASSTYWIAGDTADDGIAGWIQFGLNSRGIISDYMRWDVDLVDSTAISSEDMPTYYLDSTSNVQVALNSITDNISGIIEGSLLGPKSVTYDNVGFTSADVPFANSQGKFDVAYETVEQVLNFLRYSTADQILFLEPHDFGLGITSNADNVQQALLDIDKYFENLNADKVKALIPSTSVWSSVQSILDMLNSNIANISYVGLVGTPENYGLDKQFLRTNGEDSVYYSDVYASDIICQYPGTVANTVQGALAIIDSRINELSGGNLRLDSSDISYDDSPSIGLNNVDDVLDYLIRECFTAANLPEASQVSSVSIGNTNNVQASLEFIQIEVEALQASGGTELCEASISPLSLSANSLVTLAIPRQDYLLLTHTYGGTTETNVFISARIVVHSSSLDQDLVASIEGNDSVTIAKELLYPGYTITLMAKATLSPNETINLTVSSTSDGCDSIVIKDYRMLIQPSL